MLESEDPVPGSDRDGPLGSPPLLILGIILGLTTGIGHSLAYLASRAFTAAGHGTTLQLLARAHALLGLVAAAALPFFLDPPRFSGLGWGWAYPLLATAGFVCGQAAMFTSLKYTDASRAAPMLALKIPVLAVFGSVVLGQPLGALQWVSVGLAVAAAFALNGVGGRIPTPALLRLGVAILAYAATDSFITRFIGLIARPEDTAVERCAVAVTAACFTYILAGVLAASLLPRLGSRELRDWVRAGPYTATWILAMVSLYGGFAILGVVYTNILQSSRTLWSVLLGAALAHHGWSHLEAKHGAGVVARRIAAATLMLAAVVLFALTGERADPAGRAGAAGVDHAPPPALSDVTNHKGGAGSASEPGA